MRIAVTGARGRLGRAVCTAIVAAGHAVVGIDRVPAPDDPEGRTRDLHDHTALVSDLAGCDALVHLAALPTPASGTPTEVWGQNCVTAGVALFSAAEAGIRTVVLASSQSVLGLPWAPEVLPPDYLPVDEDHPCRPSDPYSASKLAGEMLAAAMCRKGTLDVACLRFPVLWDASGHAEIVRRRLDDQQQCAKSLWAYLDLRDAARAVLLCLTQRQSGYRLLNITAARAFAPAPVAELIRQWFPALVDIRVPLAADTPLFDGRRAEAAIGFRARYVWTPGGIAS